MADSEFPCRTKTITGTTYVIRMYDETGAERMSTSDEDEESANRYVERMTALLSERGMKCTFKITSRPWTLEVCIECGEESMW